MMKTAILLGLTGLISAIGPAPVRPTTVSDARFAATTPHLTTDAAGNPLLSWAEKVGEKKAAFYFAISKDGGQTFGDKVRIDAPADLSTHAEGMPKVAQKRDGSWLAVFEVPRPTTESRFAGDLLYTTSTDQGKTWSAPKALHQDVAAGKSHSFSDLTRLPNGEIGIVWLDDKLAGQEGRPVKFRQTLPGGGFGPEVLVDDNACQCCRTNVFVDNQQRIHLTYRDMLPAPAAGAVGARDISHAVSTDGGRTFSQPQPVLVDNWQVNACPHAGPSVAQVGSAVFATWFSGKEGAVGLRLARLGEAEPVALILSNRAKHPQLAALGSQLVWTWDESFRKPGQPADEPMPQYIQRIALRGSADRAGSPTQFLTPDDVNAAFPVLLPTKNGLLVAYEQTANGQKTVIATQLIPMPQP